MPNTRTSTSPGSKQSSVEELTQAPSHHWTIQRFTSSTPLQRLHALLDVFADAFDDFENYRSARPNQAYLSRLLANDSIIALAAGDGERVVGGLVAYELHKLEQARSEIYIYDLAVSPAFQRRGIATALIDELQALARDRAARVIYVQADYGDEPAIALYTKMGQREDVMHFDIPIRRPNP